MRQPRDNRGVFPVVLEGRRVRLRELDRGDATAVQQWLDDEGVTRFVPIGPLDQIGTEAWLADAIAAARVEPRVDYTIGIATESELVGSITLSIDSSEHQRAEIAFAVRRDRWGRGFATEAVQLVLGFGFDDLGMHRIWAVCDPENDRSRRVLEKAGMQLEGRLRHDLLIRGEWRDSLVFGALNRGG